MRKTVHDQLHLVPAIVDHQHAHELQAVSDRLDQIPEAVELVYADLTRFGARTDTGREGMSAERVLRCTVVKQMNGWSYEELAFHLGDSYSYRALCRFGLGDEAPKTSTLKSNLKRVRAETWQAINRLLLGQANDEGIDKGRKVRTDCTVVETTIHEPSDSSLLWDCVRVLDRLMTQAREKVAVLFTDHRRRAKRRAIGIKNAATRKKRRKLYQDLLEVTAKTVGYARAVAKALDDYQGSSMLDLLAAETLALKLRGYVQLTEQVMDQTRRRVLDGEMVAASEKLVSIFETHTDIIVKDRRETLFGHKLCLTGGASGPASRPASRS